VATDSTLGQPISDTATLSGATVDATGTITFSVYGPFTDADPTTDVCDETTLAEELDPVAIGSPNENGDYVVSSGNYTPTTVGRYQWVVSYSGDANNDAVTSECNAANEQSVVTDDGGGGGGGGGNNDNNRNNNRNNNDNDNNRNNNNNRGVARGATDHQYGGNLDIGNLGLGDNPGFGAGQDTNIPEDVIADTIPDGELPFTGGPPLLGLAVIGLACAGLGVSVLRGALRRTRDR
jgi:hypothetical protein